MTTREENLRTLWEEGHSAVLWKVYYTLWRMDDRNITQKELAAELRRSVTFVSRSLGGGKLLSANMLERNLEELDDAITRITERRAS